MNRALKKGGGKGKVMTRKTCRDSIVIGSYDHYHHHSAIKTWKTLMTTRREIYEGKQCPVEAIITITIISRVSLTNLEIEKGLRPKWSTPSLKENLDNFDGNKQRDMRGNK